MDEETDPACRVVLIEDHPMFAEALELALGGFGVHVVARADRLHDGLALVDTLRPDVVLLEDRLPDGDCVEGIRGIQERVPGIPVVVLAAATDQAAAVEVYAAGARGHVTTHAAVDELVSAIRTAAAGTSRIPARLVGPVMDKLRDGAGAPDLTSREQQTVELLDRGVGIDGIAEAMHVSRNTSRKHVQAVLDKLGAHSQLEAVAIARRRGILHL